jgi:glycolate oxidase iron-sulfur subunit
VPMRQVRKTLPTDRHTRKMLILEGCIQRTATPNTNDAARRVLNKLGITHRRTTSRVLRRCELPFGGTR